MSHVIEQADDLRKRAIDVLLAERTAIDERLALLSYDGVQTADGFSKRKQCSRCGSADHNARRCPQANARATPSQTDAAPQS